jgi:hypothetical protein
MQFASNTKSHIVTDTYSTTAFSSLLAYKTIQTSITQLRHVRQEADKPQVYIDNICGNYQLYTKSCTNQLVNV